MNIQLSENDILQIKNIGISKETIKEQVNCFIKGFPKLNIEKPATINNGIVILNSESQEKYQNLFDNYKDNFEIIKFVPASGMASRMFKDLYTFIEKFEETEKAYKDFINGKRFSSVQLFLEQLEHFPFYELLKNKLEKQGKNLDKMRVMRSFKAILKAILEKEGLNYGFLPKALLLFHTYSKDSKPSYRTSLQEHFIEAFECFKGKKQKPIGLHFTISSEHESLFNEHLNKIIKCYKKIYRTNFQASYSFQNSSTDTVAVDESNVLFRTNNGQLFFRRGGHGALLQNLNKLKSDIVFVKNIDNISHENQQTLTYKWKKILGGLFIETQRNIFNLIVRLEKVESIDLLPIEKEITKNYNIILPLDYEKKTLNQKKKYLKNRLNRPIRVAGMVANTGQAGGGPFWIKDNKGLITLQIIESVQIDETDLEQVALSKKATHFNPVDLVFGTKDYTGKKFDLLKFQDPNTGFISSKTINGKKIKALELPGLWNGSMANWITIFVEVPAKTFNPVKYVNDLLKPMHLA